MQQEVNFILGLLSGVAFYFLFDVVRYRQRQKLRQRRREAILRSRL